MFSLLKRLFQGKKQKPTSPPIIQSVIPKKPSFSPPNKSIISDAKINNIRSVLNEQLSLDELQELCISLEIPFETLRGDTMTGKVKSLVAHFDESPQILNLLVDACTQMFPEIDWANTPPKAKINSRILLQRMKYCFNKNEFRNLCRELGIIYDNLPGNHSSKIRELVVYLQRKRRLSELQKVCARLRPNFEWYAQGDFVEPYQLKNLGTFQQLLNNKLDEEAIRQLCETLDVNYRHLPEWEHGGMARELVLYLARRKRVEELVLLCNEQLPDLPWNETLFKQYTPSYASTKDTSVDQARITRELEKLDENSLRSFCLSLNINYDDLPDRNKIIELLAYMQRHQRMPDLVEAMDNFIGVSQ